MSDLLTRDRLVFNQKAKIIEMNIDFAIRDPDGNEVGRIHQEGQSKLKKLARFVTSVDQFLTHTLSVYDGAGTKVVEFTRPAKRLKSTVVVKDGSGDEVGKIVQQNAIGKIRFALQDPRGSSSDRSTPRTGARGTSRSATPPGPRSPGSRRPGRDWPRPCSPRPTTTCWRSTVPGSPTRSGG